MKQHPNRQARLGYLQRGEALDLGDVKAGVRGGASDGGDLGEVQRRLEQPGERERERKRERERDATSQSQDAVVRIPSGECIVWCSECVRDHETLRHRKRRSRDGQVFPRDYLELDLQVGTLRLVEDVTDELTLMLARLGHANQEVERELRSASRMWQLLSRLPSCRVACVELVVQSDGHI